MSRLEDAIDRIHRWLRDYAPHREALLQPPLTRQQIDDLAGTTGVMLPQEVYGLYGWRNGIADRECLFPGYEFRPLADSVEDLTAYWNDENLRGLDDCAWLFVFPVQYTYGGYALFCDPKPRLTAPVDYDAAGAVTDSLTELVTILSERFEDGAFVVDGEGDLDFATGYSHLGFDREECYTRMLTEDWQAMSQAILLLRHSDQQVRWRAANLVGNSQHFHQYDWVRPLADYFAGELTQTEIPKPLRDDLILSFGKTRDRRAIPFLEELGKKADMRGAVARMCLARLRQDVGKH